MGEIASTQFHGTDGHFILTKGTIEKDRAPLHRP